MQKLTRTIVLAGTLAALPAMASTQATGNAANSSSRAPQASTAIGTPAQGATVYDASGNVVGTIESIDNQFAVLATAKSKVKLPLSSFGAGPKGPLLGMTAAQVDAAASTAAPAPGPAMPPKLEKGTAVSDTSGAPVGTIDSVDSQFATVATSKSKVRLPVSAFASGTNGAVIGMTAAQLDAAASASTAGQKSGS